MANVTDDIITIMRDVKDPSFEVADPDAPLRDIGIDSLEAANVFLGIEEKFGIKIPDAEIDRLNTLRMIADYVEARLGRG